MGFVGDILAMLGVLLIALGGVFFYQYFQNVLNAGASGSSASTSQLLSVYNSTANMPIIITLAIFGLASLIVGALFIVGGHIGEQLAGQRMTSISDEQQIATTRPARACTKCGAVLYQNSAHCPNCGNALRTQNPCSPGT